MSNQTSYDINVVNAGIKAYEEKMGYAFLFMELSGKARKIDTSDGCQVWNFPDRLSADRLSIVLENVKIVGGSGNRKYVTHHIKEDTDFGVVLTKENLEAIKKTYEATFYDWSYDIPMNSGPEIFQDRTKADVLKAVDQKLQK